MRPAKLSKVPGYGLSDPGAEFVDGLLGCWLGPLAERLGVAGAEATLRGRINVYGGFDPEDRTRLFTASNRRAFRPVIGGNVFAPKSLCGLLAFAPADTRRKVELAYALSVKETVLREVLPDLAARAGKGGRDRRPAELMCVIDKHVTDSAGHYRLHFHVSIVNRGRCADGVYRALDSRPLFANQRAYAVDTDARVAPRVLRDTGVALRPGPGGTLEVEGLDGFRGVQTPMRARIFRALKAAGRAATAKAVHFEALRQRGAQRVRATVAAALANTRRWVREAGIDVRRAVAKPAREANELVKSSLADLAVRRARRLVSVLGRPVTRREFDVLAKAEGTRRFADPGRVATLVADAFRYPAAFGLLPAAGGRVTTPAVERSRRRAADAVAALAKRRAHPFAPRAVAAVRLGIAPAAVEAVVRQFPRRATTLGHLPPALTHLVRAHAAGAAG